MTSRIVDDPTAAGWVETSPGFWEFSNGAVAEEAPIDGNQYARQDAAWSEVVIPEVPDFVETDPTVPSHVKSITTTNISHWNTAWDEATEANGWGNHADAGYATETWVNDKGYSTYTGEDAVKTTGSQTIEGACTFSSAATFSEGATAKTLVTTRGTNGYFLKADYGTTGVSTSFNHNGGGAGFSINPAGGSMTVSGSLKSDSIEFPNGGGWNMTDANWIRAMGGKGVYVANSGNQAIAAAGDVCAYYSDVRLKDVKGQIENPLDKVEAIETFYYTHNDLAKELGYEGDDMQVGVSAQSVKSVMPEVVTRAPVDMDADGGSISGEDYMTVKYDRLVPLLLESVKQLTARVRELESGNS